MEETDGDLNKELKMRCQYKELVVNKPAPDRRVAERR